MQVITHKQGATFSWGGTVLLPAGAWTATCEARDRDDVVRGTLQVALAPLEEPTEEASHSILITCAPTATALWPVAKLDCDVRFTDASVVPVVQPTDTFTLNVVKRITDA